MFTKDEMQEFRSEYGPSALLDTINRARVTIHQNKFTRTKEMAKSEPTVLMVQPDTSILACEPPGETLVPSPPEFKPSKVILLCIL